MAQVNGSNKSLESSIWDAAAVGSEAECDRDGHIIGASVVQQLFRMALFALSAPAAFANAGVPVNSPSLVYATYIGTGKNSVLYGLAVDTTGYAYLAGSGPGIGSSQCGFLTKLNQAATVAIWSVCLPVVKAGAVAIDTAGYIYVAGTNADYSTSVMKLSADGQHTLYSTQITGSDAAAIVVDGQETLTFQVRRGRCSSRRPGHPWRREGGPLRRS